MSEPKKHHIVPVFYLKQWALSNGKLVHYYRPHRKVVADYVAPSATGYMKELYSMHGYNPAVVNLIEKAYMGPVVDKAGAEALAALIEQRGPDLDPEIRRGWTRFLMALRLRTPGMVKHIVEEGEKNLREHLNLKPEEYNSMRKDNDPPTFVEWVEKSAPAIFKNLGKQLLPELIDNDKIGTAIIRMMWWTIGITQDFPDFLICDNPFYMSHGLEDSRCVIAVPLSPRFAFLATHNAETYNEVMAEGGKVFAERLNNIMAKQAERFVYGTNKRHLRFVENRLAERT